MLFATLACLPRALAAQGTLEGTVRDGAGQPVAGDGITLSALDLTGVTGAGGAYRIAGVPAGAHEVRFARIGYETQTLEVVIRGEGTLRVNVTLIEAAIALERLVVIGSRAQPRTATQSMVPLDVVPLVLAVVLVPDVVVWVVAPSSSSSSSSSPPQPIRAAAARPAPPIRPPRSRVRLSTECVHQPDTRSFCSMAMA